MLIGGRFVLANPTPPVLPDDQTTRFSKTELDAQAGLSQLPVHCEGCVSPRKAGGGFLTDHSRVTGPQKVNHAMRVSQRVRLSVLVV